MQSAGVHWGPALLGTCSLAVHAAALACLHIISLQCTGSMTSECSACAIQKKKSLTVSLRAETAKHAVPLPTVAAACGNTIYFGSGEPDVYSDYIDLNGRTCAA